MENKNDNHDSAVSQEFLEAEREKNYQERLQAENYLLMGGYSDRTDVVNQVQELADALTRQSRTIADQMSTIQEQELAIVMLRDYILKNGLKPFWNVNRGQHNKVDISFIDKLEKPELLAKNKDISNKYKRAGSTETAPWPTTEELEAKYKERVSPAIDALVDLMSNGKPSAEVPNLGPELPNLGSDESIGNFGMHDED